MAKKVPPPTPPEPVKQTWKYPGAWTGGGKPITRIVVNVDTQRAMLYHGEEEVGWTYVASGITSYPTPTGEFKILEKRKDKVSNLYGKSYDAEGKLVNSDFKQGRDVLPPGGRFEAAPMKYFMRLTNDGVGMHIGIISKPGRRASHGCIRLPSKMAPILYERVSLGTPVTITGKGPDYPAYLKQSAERAKANAAKHAAAIQKQAEEEAKKAAEAAQGSNVPLPIRTDSGAPAVKPATPEMKVPEPPTPGSPTQTKPPLPVPQGNAQQ
jgi:lipoprotein-anchoring transpeptidase ErfK/SrfK